jgi:nucleoside diphosphate kinase
MITTDSRRWPAKHAARALLGYVLEARLCGAMPEPGVAVSSPWDVWWACYRAGLSLDALAQGIVVRDPQCPVCIRRALRLAAASPPGHPGSGLTSCGCLLEWAQRMRAPGPAVAWPPTSLTLALLKPDAPAATIQGLLAGVFDALAARELTLSTADTRRMYPEAYGASYVRDRDAYLTSGPVHVLILRARRPGADPAAVKTQIRAQAGAGTLRNHLHMPDNPGEALADIAHFAGHPELAQLHRRYERDHTTQRLAFYRAALGVSSPGADRLPAAG